MAGEVVEAFGADPARVRVVHPGVPDLPAPTAAEAAAALARLLPPGTGRYCLAVGTAEPRKDLPGLVRAFERGGCPPRRRRARPRRAAGVGRAGAGVGPRRVAGAGTGSSARVGSSRRDLAALLGHASVLAYPSLYEGFGFPPLQAMRAGVPVVATRAGSLPEVLGRRRPAGRAGDHDRLVDALDACLGDEAPARPPHCRRHGLVAPATRGSAAAPASRRSTATRRTAVAERSAPTVLLAVEQLRRRVPGGIGVYARGLLGGLAALLGGADAVEVTLLASRAPGAAPSATRWPPSGGRCIASRLPGRAADPGLGPRAVHAPGGLRRRALGVAGRAPAPASSAARLVVTVHDVAWRRHPDATTRAGAALARGGARAPARRGRRWSSRPGWWPPTSWRRVLTRPGSRSCRAAPITCPPPIPGRPMPSSAAPGSRGSSSSLSARSSRARTWTGSCGPSAAGARLAAGPLATRDRRARRVGPGAGGSPVRPTTSSSPAPCPTRPGRALPPGPRLCLRAADRGLRPAAPRGDARRHPDRGVRRGAERARPRCDGAAPARIVDPLDVDDIAGGLVAVLTDDALRADLARRGVALRVGAHLARRRPRLTSTCGGRCGDGRSPRPLARRLRCPRTTGWGRLLHHGARPRAGRARRRRADAGGAATATRSAGASSPAARRCAATSPSRGRPGWASSSSASLRCCAPSGCRSTTGRTTRCRPGHRFPAR